MLFGPVSGNVDRGDHNTLPHVGIKFFKKKKICIKIGALLIYSVTQLIGAVKQRSSIKNSFHFLAL